MARIKLEARKLTVEEKCAKGCTIIEWSTDNPKVPGNEVALQKFAEVNAKLERVRAELNALQIALASKMSEQNAAVKEWDSAATGLASYTECATGGDASGILSAGFGVRDRKTPPPALEAVSGVRVSVSGNPGYSNLRWLPLKGTVAYVIEGTDDPKALEGWTHAGWSTRAKFTANGAVPGRPHWYRVAALNAAGQGPWSAPALRAVV